MGRTITSFLQLPEYTKWLPNNATLNSKDIAKILNISRPALVRRVQAGTFPKHDFDSAGISNCKYHWKLATLREFEKNQINNQGK